MSRVYKHSEAWDEYYPVFIMPTKSPIIQDCLKYSERSHNIDYILSTDRFFIDFFNTKPMEIMSFLEVVRQAYDAHLGNKDLPPFYIYGIIAGKGNSKIIATGSTVVYSSQVNPLTLSRGYARSKEIVWD
jgi:hypothetical protein